MELARLRAWPTTRAIPFSAGVLTPLGLDVHRKELEGSALKSLAIGL